MAEERELSLAGSLVGSPCHGPGEVANLSRSVWMCLATLNGGRLCGALFDVAADGTMSILKVESTEEQREAQRQALATGEPREWTVADVTSASEREGSCAVDCDDVTEGGGVSFAGIPAGPYCAAAGRLPQAGDRIRVFGRFGQTVRGVDVLQKKAHGSPPEFVDTWVPVYFKTDV